MVSERVPVTRDERRRRGGAWWILPLLLVGLGGCYLLQRQPVAAFTVTEPLDAAQARGPVTLTGTGTPGETVTVTENGAQVATTQIADDGTFQVAAETPPAGEHTYTVAQSGTKEGVTRTVTVAAPAAPPVQAAAPTSELAFTAPAAGDTVAAVGLTLRGTGPADTDVTVTEDGVELGQTRTDASGRWTFDVPAPAAGARVYRAAADGMSSTLNVTVGVGTQSGRCTRAFTLSLGDGQSVTEPFRFGGQGSGKSYVVTVSRGTRQVGQKTLLLDASCGWSYTSRPGPGRITYTLRESGQGIVAGTVTLTVTR